jgi:hypothetical protein
MIALMTKVRPYSVNLTVPAKGQKDCRCSEQKRLMHCELPYFSVHTSGDHVVGPFACRPKSPLMRSPSVPIFRKRSLLFRIDRLCSCAFSSNRVLRLLAAGHSSSPIVVETASRCCSSIVSVHPVGSLGRQLGRLECHQRRNVTLVDCVRHAAFAEIMRAGPAHAKAFGRLHAVVDVHCIDRELA